jgi:tRNA threonylcarbamoyladenosine dehydratase
MERIADQLLAPPFAPDQEDIDFDRRFGGVARLYGKAGLACLRQARVCVVGVGGVGSWVVEALARSAVGHLTLVDLDNIAESNINRQLHALSDTLGLAKVTALSQRIAQINPYCTVVEVEDFLTEDNLETILRAGFDYVIDAVDDVRAKTAMIAWCRKHGVPLITIGGAGGQLDPTRIEIRDLARTEQEPLLAKVRKRLRAQHGFPRGEKSRFGIEAVFSTEPLRYPETVSETSASCEVGVAGLNCAGFGSSVAVTASFGFAAAARVLQKLAEG